MFNEEEKKQLLAAYDGGIKSVAKANTPRILQLSEELGRDVKEIKVCIYSTHAIVLGSGAGADYL